ncbi:hypothetical protein R8Z50_14230 [Longispora sp. K20-0274]|uniref:hypothetical protein n=1 Tax=Longispora sp. K20-0274 TaxID=3088255 RepID=UPI00399BE1E3
MTEQPGFARDPADDDATGRVMDLGALEVEPPPPVIRALPRRLRLRHRLVAAVGAAVVLGAAVVAWTAGDEPAPHPTASPQSPASVRDITVFSGNRLYFPDGTQGGVGRTIGAVYETPDGLLVSYDDDTQGVGYTMMLVRLDRTVRVLVEHSVSRIAVAPDGRRFAWRPTAETLSVGHVGADGPAQVDRTTHLLEGRELEPRLYTGTAVVLGRDQNTGGAQYDVWFPDRGDYQPSWFHTAHVTGVYGQLPGTFDLLGTVRRPETGENCLARLDPEQALRAVRTVCGVTPQLKDTGRVSPDGSWLAVPTVDRASGRSGVGVLDLDTVFDRPRFVATWDADGPGAWLDATTMTGRRDDGSPWRWRTDGGPPTRVTTPGLPDPKAQWVGFATRLS